MLDTLRVALMQTSPVLGELEKNLEDLHERLDHLPDADLAVAPELALSGYSLGLLDEVEALRASDPRLTALGRHHPAVVTGFVESRRHDQYNSAAIVDGDDVHVQRKLFLPTYRGWEERKHFRPGSVLRRLDLRGTTMGVLVCNDLWQPPMPWLSVHGGAEVLVTIASSSQSHAAVPVQRAWDILITHAAVTLQCYVIFVNRVGTEPDREFWGGSYVVGPDGTELLRLGDQPETAEVDLDLAAVRDLRRHWPLLREPRLDLVDREVSALLNEEE